MTAFDHIIVSLIKIPRIPRIRNAPICPGMIQQLSDLVLRITTADPLDIPHIGVVHADQIIKFIIVRLRDLPRIMPLERDSVLPQLPLRPRVRIIADLSRLVAADSM